MKRSSKDVLLAMCLLCMAALSTAKEVDADLQKLVEELEDRVAKMEVEEMKKDMAEVKDELEDRVAKLEELAQVGTLRTCAEYGKYGLQRSGAYMVDPDGGLIGEEPFQCKVGLGFFIFLSVVSYVALGVTLWMTIAELMKVKVEVLGLRKNVEKSKTLLPFTTKGLSWEGNPVKIGFITSTSGVQSFNLPDDLPMNASMVRIIAFHTSGNEGPEREVLYKIWTEVSAGEHVHFLYGVRYTQEALSFQAPEFWFPIEKTGRTIKALTKSRQPFNDHGVSLYVSGYFDSYH